MISLLVKFLYLFGNLIFITQLLQFSYFQTWVFFEGRQYSFLFYHIFYTFQPRLNTSIF